MTGFVAAVCVASAAVALFRWLRVCQREHYIAGSCARFAGRWIRVRPANAALSGIAAGALAVAVWAEARGLSGVAGVGALTVAGCAAVFPWPMPLVGEPRLRFTPRARRLAAVSVAVVAGCAGAAVLMSPAGPRVAAAVACLLVPGVVDAAAAVAAPVERRLLLKYRRRAEQRLAVVSPTVIAVTGSWGKTSTKQHIRDLLGGDAAVVASPASFNNAAGLSRTVNEHLSDGTEVLVAEMGMYKPGEIRDLCSWIRPSIAVITSIGPMHLERAGSMERIVAGKAEVLERADTAVLWVDDPRLSALAQSCMPSEPSNPPGPSALSVPSGSSGLSRLWRVGARGGECLDVEVEVVDDEVVVWAGGGEIGRCPAAGGVHPGNVGCAVAAALAWGAAPGRLGARLATLTGPQHRSAVQRSPDGVLVIDDTFNSNPAGASTALEVLNRSVAGRRAVVTPGMVELGSEQFRANAELAAAVARAGATLVVVGRTNRRALLSGAAGASVVAAAGRPAAAPPVLGESGVPGSAVAVRNRSEARQWVRSSLSAGDGVLWENDLPDHYP